MLLKLYSLYIHGDLEQRALQGLKKLSSSSAQLNAKEATRMYINSMEKNPAFAKKLFQMQLEISDYKS